MKLIIGNKNYSSWSLRPWMLLHAHGLDFQETQESLSRKDLSSRLGQYSDSRKVPVLIDGDITVWDSLSICEYISERYLRGNGWPFDIQRRAIARSICSEMHSGFHSLRSEMPLNCRLKTCLTVTESAAQDIERIESIWSEYASTDENGDLRLLGEFNISDCFYAPVALRFRTYGISLNGLAGEYQASLLEHPSLLEWVSLAKREIEVIPENEI